MYSEKFIDICEKTKNIVKSNYHIPFPDADLWDFLSTADQMKQSWFNPSYSQVGYKYIENEDSHGICLFISRKTQLILEDNNPLENINFRNLWAFLEIIEEISHFLVLTVFIEMNLNIKRIEMEIAAFIDKILVSFELAKHQWNEAMLKWNAMYLRHFIFEYNEPYYQIQDTEAERYRIAHRVWSQAFRDIWWLRKNKKNIMNKLLFSSLWDKINWSWTHCSPLSITSLVLHPFFATKPNS